MVSDWELENSPYLNRNQLHHFSNETMAKQPEGKPKNDKSQPTKTLKEKRAAKAAKKESKKRD